MTRAAGAEVLTRAEVAVVVPDWQRACACRMLVKKVDVIHLSKSFSMSLSVPTDLSTYPTVCLIYVAMAMTYLFIYLSSYLYNLFSYLSIDLLTVPVCQSMGLFVFPVLCASLSRHLFAYLP